MLGNHIQSMIERSCDHNITILYIIEDKVWLFIRNITITNDLKG